ncbi:MAG: class I SAM-dependent methyltransferase [Actinomycetota bacterium]
MDCSAGSGFPALALAADDQLDVTIHCTDTSEEMLDVLARRAKELQVDLSDLAPEELRGTGPAIRDLRLDWDDLDRLPPVYDCVMCRGNSLVYANTWSGGDQVADRRAIFRYLKKMAAILRPGGILHVDAPWNLALPTSRYQPLSYGKNSIWEKVTIEPDRRHWLVTFRNPMGETKSFERYSTLLTAYDIAAMLPKLGFEPTRPIRLDGERPTLGVIIARKRHGPPAE